MQFLSKVGCRIVSFYKTSISAELYGELQIVVGYDGHGTKLCLAMYGAAAKGQSNWKQTNLQFYMHDLPTKTGVVVVAAPGRAANTIGFGTVVVIDDALTEGPSPNSKAVGRAQGTYMISQLDSNSLLMTFAAVFSPDYPLKGTLSFHGADRIILKQREISVVGGTEDFRFAQGFALPWVYEFEVGFWSNAILQ